MLIDSEVYSTVTYSLSENYADWLRSIFYCYLLSEQQQAYLHFALE